MSVPYQNPISSVQVSTPQSVSRTSVFGTNFSVNGVGGYMEVYKLSDLSLTLTASTYPSLIQLSANTIPIRYTKGDGTFLSPDYITLNSDNISSGRRRLGMLVYVHETDKVYQYVISNYDTLWDNLSGLTGFSSVTYSDYTTVINNRSSSGQSFISEWTASTIEGVSGYTSANANWRIFQSGSSGETVSGYYLPLSGGTVSGGTIFTNGLTANTISATTYYNLPITITGGTYSSGTTFLNNSTGGTINLTGYTYIPHLEYDNSNSTLWNNGFGNVSTNISFGQNALVSNTSGIYNTAIGGESLSATTTGNYNTGIGGGSLTNNTTGTQNFGIGSFALYYNTSGSFNTAIGTAALQDNTVAQRNVAIGGFSLYRNTGDRNIAIGFYAGVATKGSDNILLGANANNITDGVVSGSNNTIIGTLLSGVVNGSNNTIFGKPTGLSSTTTNNIVIADGSGNIRFRDDNINTILSRLAGSGDRMVIAGSNGELSARTITDTTFTGGTVSGATEFTGGLTANTISATTYQNLPPPVITGTTNYIPKFTSGTTLTNSLIYDSFSGTGINTATPIAMLDIKLSATTDYILNLKDVSDNEFFRINKAGGIFINTGATAYDAFLPTHSGIYINGDGSTSYGSNVYNKNIITFMQTFTSGAISGIQAATLNYGNVRCGLYFQNNTSPRPELFGTSVVEGAVVETFRITEGGSFNIGGLNTDNSRFTIKNSRLTLGSKAFSILNSASTENVFFNDNGDSKFNGSLTANTLTVTGNTSLQGLTATTISATTYQNLPTDIRVTGATYSNNTFTYTNNNSGGTFSVLFNTVTGLTANTLTVTGTTFNGNGTFTKAGFASGDILLDNSSNDTPGLLMYYANNSNYGIDSWNGSFDVLSGQLVRITNNLNESGGAVKMAIDTTGNMVVVGFVKANAWRAGQVVNDIILSNTEVTISTTTIATSTSDTDFLTYSYTPLSSTSYLVIHYHLASYSFEGGTGNDSYFSRIKVDGVEQSYSRQSTVNGNRTGVLFPLTGRYTNSSTSAKSIVVACRRDSADDSITIVNSATSMWLRITEIGR